MATELKMLLAAILLGIIQLMLQAQGVTSQFGAKWNLSARDQKMPELKGIPGRLDRSFKNFMETFPFFAAAVLVAQVTGRFNDVSSAGAVIYFAARVVYVPLYAAGIPVVRTLTWLISMVGIVMVLSVHV